MEELWFFFESSGNFGQFLFRVLLTCLIILLVWTFLAWVIGFYLFKVKNIPFVRLCFISLLGFLLGFLLSGIIEIVFKPDCSFNASHVALKNCHKWKETMPMVALAISFSSMLLADLLYFIFLKRKER